MTVPVRSVRAIIGPYTVHFVDMPPEPERRAWCDWLRRHSIDPNEVLVPGWVERSETNRQVHYLALDWSENGFPVFEEGGPVRVVRTVQLEAAPAPFPKLEEDR